MYILHTQFIMHKGVVMQSVLSICPISQLPKYFMTLLYECVKQFYVLSVFMHMLQRVVIKL